ncbi:MAG: nucleotidyltransferase family protein [Candidatus Bathyarchaeia archaeon]|jgi:dTDP-glucose pyrophosphorylase
MKALILAGGRGKRLGEITANTNKCMLMLGKKPVIEYNLERASSIDEIKEIILVVGHRAEDIINYFGTEFQGRRIRYVIQWEQKGLVHAIEVAKKALETDDFFLLLGDEILLGSRQKEMYRQFVKENVFALCGVTKQSDESKISRTYTVLTNDSGQIFRLVEKPRVALSRWQGTGHCMFKNSILSYIELTPIHPSRGEKELPDLIQCAVDNGQIVKIFDICDGYSNINDEKDLSDAKNML